LRIACRLTEQGFIRRSDQAAPKHLMHTALAIEEWLVGGDVNPGTGPDTHRPRGPKVVSPEITAKTASGGKKKARTARARESKKSAATPKAAAVRNEQSWSDVLPSRHTTEELAQVVPATAAAGEISVADRPSSRAKARIGDSDLPKAPARERLEEKGGLESLSKIFIDESLGTLESDEKLAADKGMASMIENPSWDDITSPAKALTDPEAIAAIEEGRRLAEESKRKSAKTKKGSTTEKLQAIPETVGGNDDTPRMQVDSSEAPTPSGTGRSKSPTEPAPMPTDAEAKVEVKSDAAADAKPESKDESTLESKPAAKVEVETDAAADAKPESTDEATLESKPAAKAETKGDPTPDSEASKAESSTEPKADLLENAEVARRAHARVATTASDAVAAAAALLAVAAHRKPPKKAFKRHDSKSDADVAAVQALASGAESASHEVADFSADEEAFFTRGVEEEKAPPIPTETFEDLDDDYEIPKTFWQRFLSDPTKKAKRKKK
jgi:hypothetical protein